MNKNKNHRGITLIALIITIIVMLILVGVSVTVAINGGLFGTAKNAAKKAAKAKNAEQQLANGRIQIDGTWYDSFEDYLIGKASENQQMGDLNESNTKFIYEPAGWTNGEVKVKIEVAALTEGYTLQYSTDGINWNDYITGIPMNQSGGAIYARLLDSEGNTGEVATGNVANIDKQAPKITTALNSPSQSTSSIKLSIGVEDKSSGISKIEWYYKKSTDPESEYAKNKKTDEYKTMKGTEAGERTEVTKEVTLSNLKSGTYNVYAIVYDVAGNFTRSPEGTSVVNVTTGKVPAGESSIDFSYSNTNWTNQNVNVTITSKLEGYEVQYSKDGSTWENYTSPVEMSEKGAIYAKLIDSQGNEGTVATGNVANIDKEAPTIITAINSPSQATSSIDLSIGVEDDGSGISKIEWYYKLNNVETDYTTVTETYTEMNGSTAGTKTEVTKETTIQGLLADNTYFVYAIVYDVAGNSTRNPEGTGKRNVWTKGMPAGNSSINFSYSNENWTNQNVNVTITKASGVENYTLQYSKDEVTWENYTSPVEMSENGEIYAKLVDSQGNEGTVATGCVANIDKEAPTITPTQNTDLYVSPNDITENRMLLIAQVKDTLSGICKIEWYYKKDTENTYQVATEENTLAPMYGTTTGFTSLVTLGRWLEGLTASTKYNIYAVVYDVAGNSTRIPETGTIDVTTKTPEPQIGDYVNYEPDVATTSYKVPKEYSGWTSDQTITQEKLNWQILRIHNNGRIVLVGEPTSQTVGFYSTQGYNNGVTLMYNICNTLYSNNEIEIGARPIRIEDFEYDSSEGNWQAVRNEYTDTYKYNAGKTYTSNLSYPKLYAQEIGSGINTSTASTTGLSKSAMCEFFEPADQKRFCE